MRNFWSKKRNPLDEDMALLVEEMHSPCIENIAVFLIVARTVARTGIASGEGSFRTSEIFLSEIEEAQNVTP